MHIADVIARDGMTASFEFFPPRSDQGWTEFLGSLEPFEELRPSFVSVTYGAGGSTRDRTDALVAHLAHMVWCSHLSSMFDSGFYSNTADTRADS